MSSSKRKHLKPGEKVSLSLTLAQVELIVEKTAISGELLAVLYAARVRDTAVVVRCTLPYLNRLAVHIESEARDTKDAAYQKELADISTAVRTLEQGYSDDSSTSPRVRFSKCKQGNYSNVVPMRSRAR